MRFYPYGVQLKISRYGYARDRYDPCFEAQLQRLTQLQSAQELSQEQLCMHHMRFHTHIPQYLYNILENGYLLLMS